MHQRPPQVRFDLPEMQVLEGESRTCGGLFLTGQLKWKIGTLEHTVQQYCTLLLLKTSLTAGMSGRWALDLQGRSHSATAQSQASAPGLEH